MRYRLSKDFVYKDYGDIRLYYALGGKNHDYYEIQGSGKIIMDFINSHDTAYQEEILQYLKQNMINIQDDFEHDIKDFLDLMVEQGVIKEVC